MARRTITDLEIALIKAMHARGMANKDIQFFFNRPERPVNSGRISDIGSGRYGPEVPPATDAAVADFVSVHESEGTVAAIVVPVASQLVAVSDDPLDPARIAGMFAQDPHGVWRLIVGETDEHECKGNFGLRHRGEWLRAIAALSNNRGGYIFFGVHDKDGANEGAADMSYAVVGLPGDAFQRADPADVSKLVRSALDPTPRIRLGSAEIGGKPVGVIYVASTPAAQSSCALQMAATCVRAIYSIVTQEAPTGSSILISVQFSMNATQLLAVIFFL